MQSAQIHLTLNGLSAREHGAVNSINNRRGANHPTAKVSPIKTLDRVLSALHTVELEIDVALAVWVEGDMHDMAVLLLGLGADVVFELLFPVLSSLPALLLAILNA